MIANTTQLAPSTPDQRTATPAKLYAELYADHMSPLFPTIQHSAGFLRGYAAWFNGVGYHHCDESNELDAFDWRNGWESAWTHGQIMKQIGEAGVEVPLD